MLGPILFLVYTNDLPYHIKHYTVRLFADDCILQKEVVWNFKRIIIEWANDLAHGVKPYKMWGYVKASLMKAIPRWLQPHLHACQDCKVPWCNPHTEDLTNKLEMIQHQSARYICRRYHNTSSVVTSMLDELQCPSLQDRRSESRLKMLYKVVSCIVAQPAEQYLVSAVNHYTRQSRHRQFTQSLLKLTTFRYSFFPRTILEWNQLEDSIMSAETLAQFKTGLARSSTEYTHQDLSY